MIDPNSRSTMTDEPTADETNAATGVVILCPGQGAQHVGMGRAWYEQSAEAKAVFDEADRALADQLGGAKLSDLCFDGPAERLNRTDVSQPAIYTTSVACFAGLVERGELDPADIAAAAGLSLGEYTALHLAGVFDFATGLGLVATRGRLMQEAAEQSRGSMVALIGADEQQAEEVCAKVRGQRTEDRGHVAADASGPTLVAANFNAPGQIVLSGSLDACERAVQVAGELGLRATPLTVAGAFHSPLMQPAADRMAEYLENADFAQPRLPVYSNVTAEPHPRGGAADEGNLKLLKSRLVQQIVSPVRWSHSCQRMCSPQHVGSDRPYHELAPGTVLRGLMRRIDRNVKVASHDEP